MSPAQMWKTAALVAALIPVGVLLGFALQGGGSGIGGYGQLIPIVLLAALGWYEPRGAGFVLIFGAIALMIIYAMSARGSAAAIALVELIVFIPLVISGFLFVRAERE